MESMEVKILTFINPHLFFITEADSTHRINFLNDVSSRIKKSPAGLANSSFLIDEMVAIDYESNLVRATILEKSSNEETNKITYFCWLVDYAVLTQTDKVFKLPKEIQRITPRAKQACLNNFCYLKEQLELGIKGKIKHVPSIIPSSGVAQYCFELLSESSKLTFEVVERYNNILIGDVLIYKNDKVVHLTEELSNKGLITTDELIFQRIKFSTQEYIKTHLETIYQMSKNQKTALPSENHLHFELEEIDIDSSPCLENGRRRRSHVNRSLNSSQTSGSEDDQTPKKPQTRAERLLKTLKKTLPPTLNETDPISKTDNVLNKSLEGCEVPNQNHLGSVAAENEDKLDRSDQKVSSPESVKSEGKNLTRSARLLQLKEKKALEEAKKATEEKQTVDTKSSSDEMLKKLAERRSRRQHTSSVSTKSEEGLDSTYESSLEDSKNVEQTPDKSTSYEKSTPDSVMTSNKSESDSNKSPFGDITSQRKTKPVGLFLPAGIESRYNKENAKVPSKKASKQLKTIKRELPISNITTSSAVEDDCPTIEIPKASDNLTDDQTSMGESEDKIEKGKEEESSSSERTPPEIFTKQDFCKLVAGCTCVKCRITLEDDDWDAPIKFGSSEGESKKKKNLKAVRYLFIVIIVGLVIKPPKLLRKEAENEAFIQENEILSIDYSGMTTMEKRMSCKVLVHGESIPIPIKRVAQVNIHKDICNNISRLNYKEAKRIQHYAFPAITRNQHVFMINDARSGKTMAYLPILISFVLEKEDRYSQLFKMGGGPIVVILCSNSKKCEEIYDLTKLIFDRHRSKVSLVTYPGHGNISNVDILITMPTILTTLISSRATNFKRLCHLVLEDGDVILKSHYELVRKFFEYGDQVLEHRNCAKSIQVIICAEHWTPQIEDILKKLKKVPLVCIGNHLEAALYGKINLTMKFLDTSCKEQNLQRILHDVYKFTKSIIICNPDEIEDIETFLPLKGIEYVTIPEAGNEDISYFELLWSNALPGKYSVLICTDDIYNTMNITNAQLLIHYSLPRSWTQFVRRFSCFLENDPTPLNIKERKDKVSTHVFIDENCEPRMSKFCNFIKIAGLEKDLPEKIKSFFKEISIEEEYKRATRKIELCETLKIFGRCDLLHCRKRHVIDKDLDHSEILPKNGTLKFKINKMTDATTCSIKLLENFDLKGHSVRKFDDLTDDILKVLSQKGHYSRVSKAIETHLYLHKDGDTYSRCKLIENNECALVYLIDRGIYCKSDLNKLFKMPEELKQIPQQCYEAYFAHLIPPHEDTTFSRSAKLKAQYLVDCNCSNSVMTAKIVLQLDNNLWLDDVCEEREMHDKSLPSIGYQLSRQLVKEGLAMKSDKPLSELYALSKNAGIDLPDYQIEKPKIKKVIVDQVKPQWAFLDIDALNQCHFSAGVSPEEFYIKHQKFTEQLNQLEQDIQKEIRKPFYPLPQNIEVGKCYLVKDEPTGNYSRALVLNIADDHAHAFCVDYGDEVTVPVSSLKHISNDMILKLPFQSIQCSMYGIKPIDDSWGQEATDFLYKVGFEEGTDTFRTLFVKTCSKQRNELIPKQNSYTVIIKDGFSERHVLLNNLLIDCGFAVPNGNEIQDFELPEKKEESEEENIEKVDRYQENDYDYTEDLDAFDLEIYDVEAFMTQMFPEKTVNDRKAIPEKKTENDDLPPMKAVPAVDYYTPEVYWSQMYSSITLKIKINDVQDPTIKLLHNRIFQFTTENNGKKYHLKLILFEKVEKTYQYTALGPEVRLRFTKSKQEEWPRLSYTKEKMKNVHFDFTSVQEDEKPRRLLQLDISDSSSEGEENDGLMYHVCSDLDSEYDYDIPNNE